MPSEILKTLPVSFRKESSVEHSAGPASCRKLCLMICFALSAFFIPSALHCPSSFVFAEEISPYETSHMARADFYYRQRQFDQALEELGQLSDNLQEDSVFRQRVDRALASLYQSEHRVSGEAPWVPPRPQIIQKLRVTSAKQDADNRSDQSFDHDGFQVNEHFEAEVEGRPGLHSRFVADIDGYKDGHNDLRYRTLLADFSRDSAHFSLGDSATFTSPYFLRGSRLRGVQFFSSQESNDFQLLLGAYPYWLTDGSQYIYPRTVFGIRDRVKLGENRFLFGANYTDTFDDDKIRDLDVSNHPRDNKVASLDQELKIIPGVWTVNAAESYSVTEDNLQDDQDRFGRPKALNDTAFKAESIVVQPMLRWRSYYERTGPDFRLLTDLPSGSFARTKGISADRQFIQQTIGFQPIGPLDLDLEASWLRNNLSKNDTLNHFRQGWYSLNLGLRTPTGWPQPRVRQKWIEMVSEPASTTFPPHSLTSSTDLEISHRIGKVDTGLFALYEIENPVKGTPDFDPQERWNVGTRLSRPLGDRLMASTRYKYEVENRDEIINSNNTLLRSRFRGHMHEVNNNLSIRLWSTASLGLGYTYQRNRPTQRILTNQIVTTDAHLADVTFAWPYTYLSADKRHKLSVTPGINYHWSDLSENQEKRSIAGSQLSLAYESTPSWKVELMGEYHYDKDDDNTSVRTAGSRVWLLWTSKWR